MSVRVMALVFGYEMPELKTDDGRVVPDSTSKWVLISMADHASDDGENAYIGVRRIVKKTQLSTQTVSNAINALRYNGYITYVGKSKKDTNNYTINVDRFQWLEQDDSSGQNPAIPVARTKPSVKPSVKPSTEKVKLPSPSKLIQDAVLTHYGLTIDMSWKTSQSFLKWAVETAKVTPEQIAYSKAYWDAQVWNGEKVNPGLQLIQRDWSRSIEGFGAAPITSDDQSDIDWHFGG